MQDAEHQKILTANNILVREKEELMVRLEKQTNLVEMLMNEKEKQREGQNAASSKNEALEILQKVRHQNPTLLICLPGKTAAIANVVRENGRARRHVEQDEANFERAAKRYYRIRTDT